MLIVQELGSRYHHAYSKNWQIGQWSCILSTNQPYIMYLTSYNFLNVFLQTIYIPSLSQSIYSAVFKQVSEKDVDVKTKLYELSKKWKMASKRNQCNVRNCLSSTSAKLTTLFGGKSYCYICSRLVSQPPSSAGCTTFSTIDEYESNFSTSSAAVDGFDKACHRVQY